MKDSILVDNSSPSSSQSEKVDKQKGVFYTSTRTIVFTLLIILFIRGLFFDSFRITSESMEGELLVGDYVFVSKLHYGPRLPTILKIPFVEEDMIIFRFFGTKTYSTFFSLPYLRIPGFTAVKRRDIIAFSLPIEDKPSFDLKKTYIKRCVALPGDKMQITNGKLFINGTFEEPLASCQNSYRITSSQALNEENAQSLGIADYEYQVKLDKQKNNEGNIIYTVYGNVDVINKAKSHSYIKHIEPLIAPAYFKDLDIYPQSAQKTWNKDNIGPMVIPHKGQVVTINNENSSFYFPLLKRYEGLQEVNFSAGEIFIKGKAITTYTFRNNYYFALGDNRDASIDSRYWGLIPESHILGKASAVWLSKDNSQIRWNRLFKVIN
jgi:signal peptidase I